MLFNSGVFFVFFAAFYALHHFTRGTARRWVILLGSYLFYGWWDWRFLGLIALSTVVDFAVGARMHAAQSETKRKHLLWVSLALNLGLLATFKYLGFFVESFTAFLGALGVEAHLGTLEIILPVGISFYTFQTLSYSIDIYRRHLEPEPSLLNFACFVAFFPQLVAGPIVRASDFLPQLRVDRRVTPGDIAAGLQAIAWGYLMKVVLADSLAPLVDQAFARPEIMPSSTLIVGVVFYAFQIYGDFCGYSLIAIGVARLMGYDLGINFDRPYFARGFSEFWRKWHISLSTWLRDYLYISLGGNRAGPARTQRNLMLTMLLGGLWHGAAWTFVVWGALHGLYLVVQRRIGGSFRRAMSGVPTVLVDGGLMALVFGLTCVAWVFFRAQSFDDAFAVLSRIFTLADFSLAAVPQKFVVAKGAALIAAAVVLEGLDVRYGLAARLRARPLLLAACLAAAGWCIALFGSFGANAFIYFQF